MLLALLTALLLGVASGTLTGIIPGIHVNLISIFILSLYPIFYQKIPTITITIFIVSMAITHSFIDFIPSIYLGAPDEDSFLSILPGHQLLKKGLAHEAVVLTLYGSLTALIIILIFTPLFIFTIPKIQDILTPIIPFILIFVSLYLILREKEFLISSTIFILSGFLGILTLNLPINQPLLPLLTGLFGSSTLLTSIKTSSLTLQKQKIKPLNKIKIPKRQFIKTSIAASITAPFCSFFPGIGSGQAAVIASEITDQTPRSFLFLIGTINTIVIALSFITLYSINKTRSGTAAVIKKILNPITTNNLILIIITIIISGILAFFIGIKISKIFAKQISKINYKKLSIITLIILFLINMIFSNFLGIIVFLTATSLGVFTILSKSKRINMMGSLLIPTILFYLT